MNRIIGLIAGHGQLPISVIESCLAQNIAIWPVFLDDGNDLNIPPLASIDYIILKLGQVGKLVEYFKEKKVTHIVIVGSVKRPNLTHLNVDLVGAKLIAKILKKRLLGDDNVLKTIAEFYTDYGFEILSAQNFIDKLVVEAGIIHQQDDKTLDMTSIKQGIKVAKKLGKSDIGQAVIVEDKYIIGVEAAEGTDALITRCAPLYKAKKQAILIKVAKPNQDERLDMPTIGPNTLHLANEHNIAGIVIEARKVYISEYQKVIELAKTYGIFLLAIDVSK